MKAIRFRLISVEPMILFYPHYDAITSELSLNMFYFASTKKYIYYTYQNRFD